MKHIIMAYFNYLRSVQSDVKHTISKKNKVLLSIFFLPFIVYGQLPTITTQAVTQITAITATANANITDLGNPNPTAYGVCWSTSTEPTLSDNFTDQGAASSIGAFTSSITGLTASTQYYVRAYATNNSGTVYGNEVSFTSGDPMILEYNTNLSTGATIGVPLSGTVNVVINWGDGGATEEVTSAGLKTHTYSTEGTYTVTVTGSLTVFGIRYVTANYADKLQKVLNFGELGITSFDAAFYNASNLVELPSQLPVGVINMSYMFSGASFFNGDLSSWDVSSVTNMSYMFAGTYFNGDLSSWDVSSVTDMASMFGEAPLFNGDISSWDVSSVTDMHGMFHTAESFNRNISSWDVSSVTNMYMMFTRASSFIGDLSSWDVSSVTDMSWMFSSASSFNSDLSSWNVSSVTNMYRMFNTSSFNGDLSSWDVSSVTDMSWMFVGSSFNGDLSSWDVSSVTNMSYMFNGVSSFNCDLNNWDVSSVTDMSYMFYNASSFNGDLSNWNVSSITNMYSMFNSATSFNGDLSSWDVSSVTNMYSMFNNASSFNGDLSSWDVSSVTAMGSMLFLVTLSTTNYDALLNAWSTQSLQPNVSFSGGNSKYSCLSSSARSDIISTYGWTITDGGETNLAAIITNDNNVSCPGNADGGLSVAAYCGTGSYTYLWSNAEITDSITGLTVGTYTVTVTDVGNSNTFVVSAEVTELTATSNISHVTTISGSDGSIDITTSNGLLPYVFSWSGPNGYSASTEDISDLYAGVYTLNITDNNGTGCTIIISETIKDPCLPSITTQAVTNVFATVAIVDGKITDLGNPNPTAYGVCWATLTGPTLSDSYTDEGAANSTVAFTSSITGLSASTQYYVRAYATNSVGTVYGNELSFTTGVTDPMILQYNTNLSTGTTIGVPLAGTVNVVINWGDGGATESVTSSGLKTHTYSTEGTYTVTVTGSLTAFGYLYYITDYANKLQKVLHFGNLGITSFYCAFYYASNLVEVPSQIPVGVTNMREMFYEATSFNGELSSWDVSSVTNMSGMFAVASSFNGDLSSWDVSSVTNMNGMFTVASSFNGDISSWDISSVTDMSGIFRIASSFNGDLSSWDVSNVTNLGWMFYYASSFNGDISSWNVSSATNMSQMFAVASTFNGDISSWDVSSVTNMSYMFSRASSFNVDLSSWDVSNVTNMHYLFNSATSFNGDISSWDVSSVTDMGWMFHSASSFNRNLSSWDVSIVTYMVGMFESASSFNGDLSSWDVSSVIDMRGLFSYASSFNGELSSWDVSSVTSMSGMFKNASSFNGDLSNWDVSSVADMSRMFSYASSFNGDISGWDVSNVTNMPSMLAGTLFNRDLKNWDVSSVTDMASMFMNASYFNGDIGSWDVSSVTNMRYMFNSASSFNGDLSSWDVNSVTNMSYIFYGVSLSTINYDALLNSWSTQSLQPNIDFHGGNSKYSCFSADARSSIISSFSWTITDGGIDNTISCNTWDGSESTEWNNANNWQLVSVPTSLSHVLIPDVSSASGNFPVISSTTTATCLSLTLEPDATLTIESDDTNTGSLTVQ